jgi:hypothetical protein
MSGGCSMVGYLRALLQRHTMIQIAIAFCNVEMFQCLFAAFNASEALDVLKRVFFDGRLEEHFSRV